MNTDERELSKSHDAILLEYDATSETPHKVVSHSHYFFVKIKNPIHSTIYK